MIQITRNTINPVGTYLLLEIYDKPTESESGLEIVNGTTNFMPIAGIVLKVGDKATYKVGESVVFRRYSADELNTTSLKDEETRFFLLDSSEVIAILKEDIVEVKQPTPREDKIAANLKSREL